MRGKNQYIDPKNWFLLGRNGMKMQNSIMPKFEISIFGKFGFAKNQKSPLQNLKFRCRFWILGIEIWFRNFENRFFQFLSNFDLGPKNLKSPSSKTPKSTFSLKNSNFSSTEIQNFVLGLLELPSASASAIYSLTPSWRKN